MIFILEDELRRKAWFSRELPFDMVIESSVRSAKDQFDTIVNSGAQLDLMLLDHDLGVIGKSSDKYEETGYDFCKWLVRDRSYVNYPQIVVHSQNTTGAANMVQVLRHAGLDAVHVPFDQFSLMWLCNEMAVCKRYKKDL